MWRCLVLRGCYASAVSPADVGIAVVTSSPVHESRLPSLSASWLRRAQAACASVIVVSDVGGRCESTACVETVACACSASHWGLPCKSACALTELVKRAPRARWYARVMDDTFVDVDALAAELAKFDDRAWYVGEMITVEPCKFEAALGGSGWALSARAADLAVAHLDLYHLLTWTMGCNYTDHGQVCGGPEWPLPTHHKGRRVVDSGRGLKLASPFADDIMWGTYMAALNISTSSPAGFTQAPVDVLDGIPECVGEPPPCDRRVHALGAIVENGAPVSQAYGVGSCRSKFRPAVVHVGDEVGSMPSRVWRDQFPALAEALSSSSVVATYEPAPLHYWRLCALDEKSVRPRAPPPLEPPGPLELSIDLDGKPTPLAVGLCDDPVDLAARWCQTAGADTPRCRVSVTNLATQAKDVLRRHRRPATQPIVLGDGSRVEVAINVGDHPSLIAAFYCAQWELQPEDCTSLDHALALMLPDYARAWCHQ